MKRAKRSSYRKLAGFYARGNTFWFTSRPNGKKHFHSLGASDYGEPVKAALDIRKTPAAVFGQAIDAFIAHKLRKNEYGQRSAEVKIHALKELAESTEKADPASVTTEDVTSFYRR